MLGEKLRNFRESKGLLQRQVAAKLDVDTAYISKIECNEKLISRTHLKILANLYGTTEKELLSYWLAEKLIEVVKGEDVALTALSITEREIKKNKK